MRPVACLVALAATAAAQYDVLTFHGNPQRTGWIGNERVLTPRRLAGGEFGPIWNSPQFDSVTIAGKTYPPHVYASPLYVDRFKAVYAATSNGFVYAVSASNGAILWRRQLNTPSGTLDGGVPVGVLGTPAIDLAPAPPRLYVASVDATAGWQVFALDLTTGAVQPGWPLNINDSTVGPINQNGPATFQPALQMSERGGLNLSPDGKLLYVPFGGYNDLAAGWMITVDTQKPALESAFSGAPSGVAFANAVMWASAGPAVDVDGNGYSTTGNGTLDTTNTPGYWAMSVLKWGPGAPLRLAGTYTPWNYCQMDVSDIDLAGGAAIVLPDFGEGNTRTPHLITFGGKQGNQYLVDRDHMPGSLTSRAACSNDPATDGSLVPPGPQPQFGKPGPLNVFGPYADAYGNVDYAKARSTGAYFHGATGHFLFVTGSSKAAADSQTTVPPSIVKLRINTSPGMPAYLSVEASNNTYAFLSPGSPWVTSNGTRDAIVWVLVGNVTRVASLVGTTVPHPILYALDANTLEALWISTPAMLNVGGKYNAPGFGGGMVFVGTDRIQAFGVTLGPPGPQRRH